MGAKCSFQGLCITCTTNRSPTPCLCGRIFPAPTVSLAFCLSVCVRLFSIGYLLELIHDFSFLRLLSARSSCRSRLLRPFAKLVPCSPTDIESLVAMKKKLHGKPQQTLKEKRKKVYVPCSKLKQRKKRSKKNGQTSSLDVGHINVNLREEREKREKRAK